MGEHAHWRAASLGPRVATIAIGAPVLIAVLWVGGGVLLAVVLALVLVGAMEFRRLAEAVGYRTSPVLPAGALAFPLVAGLHRWESAGAVIAALVIVAGAASLSAARRVGAPAAAATDVLGAAFVGGLFAHVILFREMVGFAALMTVLALIWANDIAAYFVGVRWGRRRLAPAISPGKSVEGFVAGLLAAMLVAAAVAWRLGWPVGPVAFIGVCAAAAGVAGDLFKSTLKRAAGVKDAGSILPGHGGILDRFDAVLFGVPVGYYLWRWTM